MHKVALVILIIVFMFPLGLAQAQNPAPNTKEDNACYAGGALETKCATLWHWVCGWYLARWQSNNGWLTPNNPFNDACVSLLPPRPNLDSATAAVATISLCTSYLGGDIIITLPTFIGNVSILNSSDGSCSGSVVSVDTAVQAPNEIIALGLCQALEPATVAALLLLPQIYGCA
jgi:hypothetical protein